MRGRKPPRRLDMRGLQKINKDLYVSEDGYRLVRKNIYRGKIRNLYSPSGEYLGQPQTIADANKWIREERKENY